MAHPGEEFALRSAAGCGRSSAARAQRDCPAAPPEVESPVPVGRSASRAPPPPALAAVFCPRGAPFCCISTFTFGPALWWRAAARAMRTVCCSCRSIERSRRSRRRRAAPEGCPLSSAIFGHAKKTEDNTNLSEPVWWLWWLWSRRDVYDMSLTKCHNSPIPDYGGRVPVDTAPGPVPMYRA